MPRSRLPTAKPRILHNYLLSEEDRATMIEAVRRCVEIAEQPALAAVTTAPYASPVGDDDSLMAFIERHSTTLYHPVGTARWGGWSTTSCGCWARRPCG